MKGFGNKEIKKKLTANELVKDKLIKQAFKYYEEGNLNYSLQCFENCLKKGFHDPKLLSEYGVILYKTGYEDKALNIFEQSKKKLESFTHHFRFFICRFFSIMIRLFICLLMRLPMKFASHSLALTLST